jgi:hypothetical protein
MENANPPPDRKPVGLLSGILSKKWEVHPEVWAVSKRRGWALNDDER